MATCLTLGGAAYLAASFADGDHTTFTDLGGFFTKAAMLTFGGAYAVLPYVFQGAVEGQHWLSAGQMIDGLALGETTPGPLIMVVAYVGFLAGWNGLPMGPDAQLGAAIAGASVATFFTFLPSFLFILAGGPLIERTHNELRVIAPLTGITAAVVGVIVHLGVYFAWHVGWPRGAIDSSLLGGLDEFAVMVFTLAAVALWRFRAGIIGVIGLAAALGALATLAGLR